MKSAIRKSIQRIHGNSSWNAQVLWNTVCELVFYRVGKKELQKLLLSLSQQRNKNRYYFINHRMQC